MLGAVIRNGNNTLVVDLPTGTMDLQTKLNAVRRGRQSYPRQAVRDHSGGGTSSPPSGAEQNARGSDVSCLLGPSYTHTVRRHSIVRFRVSS